MGMNESSFSRRERLLILALTLIAMAVTTVAVVPSLRARAKTLFFSSQREILAKVSGSISATGPRVTVLKVRDAGGLSVEIYSSEPDPQNPHLVNRFELGEKRDAFFSFRGNATNLALTDVDGDGSLEVVAPAYDDQMVARLNIFKFNPAIRSFERMQSPPDAQ